MSESQQDQLEQVKAHNVLVLKHTYALIHVNQAMLAKVVREEMSAPSDEFAAQIVMALMGVLGRFIDHMETDPGFIDETASALQPAH